MLVSHAWLREWVAADVGVHELAERLTLGGLEVASVTPAGPPLHLKRVIIGKIVRSQPHPGAARLQVCEVDVGRRARLTLVCGAANARVGEKAPVATVGARLPALEVRARTIGGVESAGMLCSAAELGLEEQSDGIMLLDADAPVGAPVGEYLDLADPVMEIELTPNRGDCLGMLGIAREVRALTGANLRATGANLRATGAAAGSGDGKTAKVRARNSARLAVELRAPRQCPRYVGRALRNVDVTARTPDWMTERLRRSGVRSLNVVVDVTNYVMLELGQPMHAFDMDKLAGGIVVRKARAGEKLRLLDGSTVKLRADSLVIADRKKAIALAGIMGGQDSAISDTTRHVYLEAAFFPAPTILGKARQFGMHTDASHRFERGVDPTMQAHAMQRATRLLVELAGGEPGPVSDARAPKLIPRPATIPFKRTEISRLLGAAVPARSVRTILERLGIAVTPDKDKAGWKVRVPGWRSDITGPHDLVEEVGRVYGFDRIAPRPPAATATAGGHSESRVCPAVIKQKLVERGYFEAITYSFVDPAIQRVLTGRRGILLNNPIADDMAAMRRSLWPGLLEALRSNRNRQHDRVRLFETGHVFLKGRGPAGERREVHHLAAAATGPVFPTQWGAPSRAVDFFDVKGDLLALLVRSADREDVQFQPARHPALHPGRSAQIKLGKAPIGYLGQLHPGHQKLLGMDQPVYLFELELPSLARTELPRFSAISRHPAVRRDLAVVVESGVKAQDVLDRARAAAGDLLVDLELFDVYAGEGIEKNHKSFAFRLTFQSESSNLRADEANAITAKIIKVLQHRFGARIRT